MKRLTIAARVCVGGLFVWVGLQHFWDPSFFTQIMPPPLERWAFELVYISGFFEVLGGVGLLWKPTRQWAAWGLLALLVAVYPANIHMLVNEVYIDGMPQEPWLLWARMPLQFVLAAGVVWVGGIWPGRRTRGMTEESVPSVPADL